MVGYLEQGQHGGMVDGNIASKQGGPMSVWVFSLYSGFLPQSKRMQLG